MNSKQRFLAVLESNVLDRLPVTTHHVMPYFFEHTMDGISVQAFFEADFDLLKVFVDEAKKYVY